MNKRIIERNKLDHDSWNMDINFMYEVKKYLRRKVNKKVLFKNLDNPKTLDERIGKAFVLSDLCTVDPFLLGVYKDFEKYYKGAVDLLPEVLNDAEKLYLSEWLLKRSIAYLKLAGRIINLEFYSFTYTGEERTQRELIGILIELARKTIENYSNENFIELMEAWKIIHRVMWW